MVFASPSAVGPALSSSRVITTASSTSTRRSLSSLCTTAIPPAVVSSGRHSSTSASSLAVLSGCSPLITIAVPPRLAAPRVVPDHGVPVVELQAFSQLASNAKRGVARLKSWRIFRRSRCSPNRMTSIAKAIILTLEGQR